VDLSLDEDDDEDDGDDNQDGGAEGIDHSDCDEHARRPVYVRAGLENTYAHTDTRSLAGSDVQDVGQRRKRAAAAETAEQRARSEAEAEREAKRRKSEQQQRDETERAWRCEAEQRRELEQRATIAAGVATAHVEAEAGAKEDEDTMRRALAEIDTDALISSLSVDDGTHHSGRLMTRRLRVSACGCVL
jgi:membrane protein involved in colicin uptake